MRKKQMPLIVKLLVFVAIFAGLGVLFFLMKDKF